MDQTGLIDNEFRSKSSGNIVKVIEIVSAWRRSLRRKHNSPVGLEVLWRVPSRPQCSIGLNSSAGKEALKNEGFTRNEFFATYDYVVPQLLPVIYHLTKKFVGYSTDLHGRFAQAVFDAGVMPHCDKEISDKLLSAIEEVDEKAFEAVRAKLITYAFLHLGNLVDKSDGGLEGYRIKYESARSSGSFLNDLFTKAHDCYALEILNTLELAGYDFDDPQIVENVLFRERTGVLPDRELV